MKFRINNKYFRWGVTAFLVIAASICFYYLVFHSSNLKANIGIAVDVLMPVVFGLAIAYLLTPVLNWIEYRVLIPLCNKCKIKESIKRHKAIRGLGILITVVLFFSVVYILLAMLLSQIVPSLQSIVSNFDTYINNFTLWVNKTLDDNPDISNYVSGIINKYSGELETWINNTVFSKSSEILMSFSLSIISFLLVLWDFILGFVIAIYLMASKEKFAGQAKKVIYAVLEKSTANVLINNLRFTHKTFIGFISGKILDSIIIGILCFIGISILDMPYTVLISVIIGVTNVIPFFGPYLGAIPTTILVFVVDPSHPLNCVYFALFILALQQFDGNILGPKILGNSTGITGFWVIFSITVFGGIFGVMGMIIGVPLFAVMYAAMKSFINTALRKKKMPEATEEYLNVGSIDDDGNFYEYIPESKKPYKAAKQEYDEAIIGFGERFRSSSEDIKTEDADQSSKQAAFEQNASEQATSEQSAVSGQSSEKSTSQKIKSK